MVKDAVYEEEWYMYPDENDVISLTHKMLHVAMMTGSAHLFTTWIKDNADKIRAFVLFGDSFLHQVLHYQHIFNTVTYAGTEYPPLTDMPLLTSLLEVCDVNARNKSNQTPLHLLSEQVWQSVQGWRTLDNPTAWENAAQILIDQGAHLKARCDGGVEADLGLGSMFSKFNMVPNLCSQSSRVIVKNRLPYGCLPKQVREYIKLQEGERKSEQQILESRRINRMSHRRTRKAKLCYIMWEMDWMWCDINIPHLSFFGTRIHPFGPSFPRPIFPSFEH